MGQSGTGKAWEAEEERNGRVRTRRHGTPRLQGGQGWRDLVLTLHALNGKSMVDLISTAPLKGVSNGPSSQRSCPALPRG